MEPPTSIILSKQLLFPDPLVWLVCRQYIPLNSVNHIPFLVLFVVCNLHQSDPSSGSMAISDPKHSMPATFTQTLTWSKVGTTYGLFGDNSRGEVRPFRPWRELGIAPPKKPPIQCHHPRPASERSWLKVARFRLLTPPKTGTLQIQTQPNMSLPLIQGPKAKTKHQRPAGACHFHLRTEACLNAENHHEISICRACDRGPASFLVSFQNSSLGNHRSLVSFELQLLIDRDHHVPSNPNLKWLNSQPQGSLPVLYAAHELTRPTKAPGKLR